MSILQKDVLQELWKDIYRYWHVAVLNGPAILASSIQPIEIQIEFNNKNNVVYGYDWLTHDEFYSRKELIQRNVTDFLYFTKATNKGTIHTLNMLIHAKTDEERAAIWMYAFAQELLNSHIVGSMYRYAIQLRDATYQFLSDKYFMWHHAMRKLLPNMFVRHGIYLDTEFQSIYAVIDLVVLNTALICYEYTPIVYTSMKSGEEPSNYSVRLQEDII